MGKVKENQQDWVKHPRASISGKLLRVLTEGEIGVITGTQWHLHLSRDMLTSSCALK